MMEHGHGSSEDEKPVLDPIRHARIIQDLQNVCMTAGIQSKYLHESMTKTCEADEVDWVRNFHKDRADGLPGLVLSKITHPDAHCQAIAAALVRNFIDARVVPINTLMASREEGLTPTVLLIPNLLVVTAGKSSPPWVVQAMFDLLLQRSVQNKPTVACVDSFADVLQIYGVPFSDFLSTFKQVEY
jgi:hypothetical protein